MRVGRQVSGGASGGNLGREQRRAGRVLSEGRGLMRWLQRDMTGERVLRKGNLNVRYGGDRPIGLDLG